jgi:hypothetical protein
VDSISTLSANKSKQQVFTDKDGVLTFKVTYHALQDAESPIYGIIISDSTGAEIFASNTTWYAAKVSDIKAGMTQEVTWSVPNIFNTGTYKISPAVANNNGTLVYDWREAMAEFKVRKKLESTAIVNMAHHLEIQPPKV